MTSYCISHLKAPLEATTPVYCWLHNLEQSPCKDGIRIGSQSLSWTRWFLPGTTLCATVQMFLMKIFWRGITWAGVDSTKNPALNKRFGIHGYPTLLMFATQLGKSWGTETPAEAEFVWICCIPRLTDEGKEMRRLMGQIANASQICKDSCLNTAQHFFFATVTMATDPSSRFWSNLDPNCEQQKTPSRSGWHNTLQPPKAPHGSLGQAKGVALLVLLHPSHVFPQSPLVWPCVAVGCCLRFAQGGWRNSPLPRT